MLIEDFNAASVYLPFWDKLSEQQKSTLASSAKLLQGGKDDILHGGKTDCSGVLIVLYGVLRAYILSQEGREITLYRMNKGDVCVFSASCILKNIHFDVFISSESEYKAVLMGTGAYEKVKEQNEEVEKFTSDLVSKRFTDTIWSIEKILFLSFDKRLALYLIEQEKQGVIKQTHEEIARNTGSAREVVTRMLGYFADEGWINLARGKITVIDKESLKELTEN